MLRPCLRAMLLAVAAAASAPADDWPTLGRDGSRNAVSPERNPTLDWQVGENARRNQNGDIVPATQDRNIRWTADLPGRSYATPVVSGGLVWIGSASDAHRNDRKPGGALSCYRESDGTLLYERRSEPLPHRANDAGWTGLGGSPLVEGEDLWYVTNRWEVVCLDIGPLLQGEGAPRERWVVDLIKEFGVYPRSLVMGPPRHCSIAPSLGDRIFVTTGNGIDESYSLIPAPGAPALVCLDKHRGTTLWTDRSPGGNVHSTEAASPLVAEIAGRGQVVVPQGDGWLRSFDPESGKLLWQFDLNRKQARLERGGRGDRNFSWATPVLYDGRIYITTGQEAEHGEGAGRLVCLDPTRSGDISSELAVDREGKPLPQRRIQAVIPADGERAVANPNSGLFWERDAAHADFERQFHRSLASVAIHDQLLIATDFAGLAHCLDARTGKWHWTYDMLATCWTNPLIVDGHVLLADEDGDVAILRLSADPKVALPEGAPLREINMGNSIYASPVFANGSLYIAALDKLYAIAGERAPRAPKSLFVPTPHEVVAKMLEVAAVTDRDVVVDLGSGDGRMVIAAAQTHGAKAIGYEIDRRLAEISGEQARQAKLDNLVTIHEQDFFTADWSEATVIAAFLYPATLKKLKPQFGKLKPGTRIVVHTFEIPEAVAEEVVEFALPQGDTYRIFRYQTPLRAPAPGRKR